MLKYVHAQIACKDKIGYRPRFRFFSRRRAPPHFAELERVCEADRIMTCPSCGTRNGRRECPALGRRICTICCGTKRLVEIRCPANCGYLQAAREHPAAVIKRQQERDLARVLPSIAHLTERQRQLFLLFHAQIAGHKPEGLGRLIDDDVAQAAAAVAATLETAARGVLYEHNPAAPPAQRLARELTAWLAEARAQGAKIYDGEAAIALRAIERGAQDTHNAPGADDDAYISLMGRLLVGGVGQRPGEAAVKPSSSLILP